MDFGYSHMPLVNYSELKAELDGARGWSHRTDLTDRIPTFITLAESAFNRLFRFVEQETIATLHCTGKLTPLPGDLLELRQVEYQGQPVRPLIYGAPQYLSALRSKGVSGCPKAYSLRGSNLELVPTPTDVEVELTYYAKIPALSDVNPTNWLLADHPGMYLNEALRQIAIYSEDQQRTASYGAQVAALYQEMVLANRAKRWGGPLVVRAA